MNENPTTPATGDGSKELLLFQMGPVQEFIAQARSTRDLWSGSYLLSWLVAHAIVAAWKAKGGHVGFDDMVMPSLRRDDNPLIFALMDQKSFVSDEEVGKALIPNLPNRFAMLVPPGTGKIRAEDAAEAIDIELGNIGKAVWTWLEDHGAKPEWEARFDAQIKAFPQTTWAVHQWDPKKESFDKAWDAVNDALAARRNTRDFRQWNPICKDAAVKDSLSGKEECIGDEDFWKALRENRLFNKASGHVYGAMNLIKRLWCHVDDADVDANYLGTHLVFKNWQIAKALAVKSLPEIAAKNSDSAVPYVAVLAFDGDHMGELVDKQKMVGQEGIRGISAALSGFALGQVPEIVREVKKHDGYLIYAGGDDVLAILPSSKAVACAEAIREAFHSAGDFNLDGSCGIAVGHFKAPLQMLVKSAQRMEGVAKNRYGRGALAIAVYKRSGEIIEWGTKWKSDSLALMGKVTEFSSEGKLSGRFPYALAALLQPYELASLKKPPQLDKQGILVEPGEFAAFKKVSLAEVSHVLERQGSNLGKDERGDFLALVEKHFDAVANGVKNQTSHIVGRELTEEEKEGRLEVHPDDFLGLFLVETFLNRKREGR